MAPVLRAAPAELDRQPRLPGAPGPSERHEAAARQRRIELGKLAVAADETGHCGGKIVPHLVTVDPGSARQPLAQVTGLGVRLGAQLAVQGGVQPVVGEQRVGPPPAREQCLHQAPVQRLVKWPVGSQRLEQRGRLPGSGAGDERTGQPPDHADPGLVQPVARGARPLGVPVLGQQLPGPRRERLAQRGHVAGIGSGGKELLGIDGQATGGAKDHDIVAQLDRRRWCAGLGQGPTGRVQRLVHVVGRCLRRPVRPESLRENIPVQPMSRSEHQQLDQRLRLAQPPIVGHHDIADPHSEPAEQPDPHGRYRHVERHQLLSPHRSLSGSAAQGVPTTIPESGCPGQGGWPSPR